MRRVSEDRVRRERNNSPLPLHPKQLFHVLFLFFCGVIRKQKTALHTLTRHFNCLLLRTNGVCKRVVFAPQSESLFDAFLARLAFFVRRAPRPEHQS